MTTDEIHHAAEIMLQQTWEKVVSKDNRIPLRDLFEVALRAMGETVNEMNQRENSHGCECITCTHKK